MICPLQYILLHCKEYKARHLLILTTSNFPTKNCLKRALWSPSILSKCRLVNLSSYWKESQLQRQRQVKKAKVYKYTRFEVPSCKYACIFFEKLCIFLVYKSQIPDCTVTAVQYHATDLTWQGDEVMHVQSTSVACPVDLYCVLCGSQLQQVAFIYLLVALITWLLGIVCRKCYVERCATSS